jgi:hypothetical protein
MRFAPPRRNPGMELLDAGFAPIDERAASRIGCDRAREV